MSLVGAQGKKIAEKEEERGDQGKREADNKVRGTKFLSSSLDISLICARFSTPVQIYVYTTIGYTQAKKIAKKKQRNTIKRGREHRFYARFKLRSCRGCGCSAASYSPSSSRSALLRSFFAAA